MKASHHNVKIKPAGLFVKNTLPYVGASPDGVMHCDCHAKATVEVKCPCSLRGMDIFQHYSKTEFIDIDETGNLNIMGRRPRQGYPGEEDPSPLVTSRLDSMGHTALPSTIDKVRPKWCVDGRPTKFPQANSPQPQGSPPCLSRVAPHGQQGAQWSGEK
ncbi:hypothetical protein ElyMa_003353400 [Elysia marginata]|uniref:YqaJ viral recombinase domain-containing protein n=1 Tax=Elysia marginata TaxID=1093978 RepID=A0AAV4JJW4_9GAST|nr:hypothetical protein ElyMa_003353400 [Elysia marginata]